MTKFEKVKAGRLSVKVRGQLRVIVGGLGAERGQVTQVWSPRFVVGWVGSAQPGRVR